MKKDELSESLSGIQAELKKIDRVDDASRELLAKLDDDIHRILGATGEVPLEHHRTLRESLERSVDHFEVSHPTLTLLMNRLIKALSDMGI
jgi:hypothetical protein